jgi:hypothetical protein
MNEPLWGEMRLRAKKNDVAVISDGTRACPLKQTGL